jgi:homoserine dehydrogenase
MQTLTIGFLGCGNIGCGVWKLLDSFSSEISHRQQIKFKVKRILVRNIDKPRDAAIPRDLFTTEPDDVLNDPEIDLIAEFLGGEDPATAFIIRALKNGKTVVTANKMAMALHWHSIMQAAKDNRSGLCYEASVCGAIPIIRTLTDSLQANRIDTMMGIINGTTNYILSRMTNHSETYQEALLGAQKIGLAEPDPVSDVDGFDAAYKLSILASLAFHARIPYELIYREGIGGVSVRDIAYGRDLGYTLKLLAIAKRKDNVVDVRVHPTFIASSHPLATVSGSFNAIFLHGHACKEMMLYGRGAGSEPTASAIVSDILYAAKHPKPLFPTFRNEPGLPNPLTVTDDWQCGFYIRFSAADRPGVLGHITTCFGLCGVSIQKILQQNSAVSGNVPIVLVTHNASEKDVHKALASIDPRIAEIQSVLRVEDGFDEYSRIL